MMHKSIRSLSILFSLALIKPVFAHDALQRMMNDDAQWASPRKDYANQAYSKLAQINARNVYGIWPLSAPNLLHSFLP